MFKSQRGISAVSLMITIVIIIMLAGYSLFFSRDTVVEGNIATAYAEIQEVSDAIKALSLDPSSVPEILAAFVIDDIGEYEDRVGADHILSEETQYYLLGYGEETVSEVMKQSMNDILGLRNIKSSYVISVKGLNDVEIYLVDGIGVNGKYCYTYDEIYMEYINVNKK